MKRKLALLLASVMAFTTLPMNVFAATENRLTVSSTIVPEKTLVSERGTRDDAGDTLGVGPISSNKDVKYRVEGTELVIDIKDEVRANDRIRLELENAVWFFRGDVSYNVPVINDARNGYVYETDASGNILTDSNGDPIIKTTSNGGGSVLIQPSVAGGMTSSNNAWAASAGTSLQALISASRDTNIYGANYGFNNSSFSTVGSRNAWGNDSDHSTQINGTTKASQTYNIAYGIWGYYTNSPDAKAGAYYRYGGNKQGSRTEVPYLLEVQPSNDKTAVLVVGEMIDKFGNKGISTYDNNYQIRIPIVARTLDGNNDVLVRILRDSNTTSISTGDYIFGIIGTGDTKTYVNDPKTARDDFSIDKLIIKENRLNTISTGKASETRSFYITAPSGFEFKDPNGTKNGNRLVEIGVERGLSWGNFDSTTATGYSVKDTRIGYGVEGQDYTIEYKNADTKEEDRSVLKVDLTGIHSSTDLLGTVYFTGLEFFAEDNASWGDIMFSISNVNSSSKIITNQTFKAGTRTDWTISLTTEGTIPELINGRYQKEDNPVDSEDVSHKTAKVVFSENSVHAWWADRQTIFSLPEGVKYRKVDITDIDNLEDSYKTALMETDYRSSSWDKAIGGGVYINDGEKHGYVTVNGNTMTWNNLKIKADEKAKIKFDVWVSIESGYKGDVTMSVSGTGIPAQGEEGTVVPAVVIAKQISPITVQSKVTDIKIGYQYQATQDIIITETKAGNLQKGKNVLVSVTDMISTDMYFSPDTKVVVTSGNLKIKDITHVATGYVAAEGTKSLNLSGGTISFDIDMASSKASTITLSNISVKVDRTVPLSNDRPYKAVVWGSAIAPNYIGYNYKAVAKDKFTTAGIMTDYVRVISAANDEAGVLTQEVKVTIGESYYTVNGKTYDMDASAYISTSSNSTMVPIRFVANAFGVSDNQVLWDDEYKTVTITLPGGGKVVQFKANDSTMLLNGVAVTMFSPDGLKVTPELVGERCYVPFRALGEAFGIEVDWETSTQTAIYNPGANRGITQGSSIATDESMNKTTGE